MITRQNYRPNAARLLLMLLSLIVVTNSISGQVYKFTPEQMQHFTPQNPFERFEDGRPKVPDALLDTLKAMEIDVIEAMDFLKQKGYPNQYDGNWQVLLPNQRMVGRAFTIQFMPTRADLNDVIQQDAKAKGYERWSHQSAIDLLQKRDIPVVDLYGKVESGTFVGEKLAYYIYKTTGTGIVIDGGLFFVDKMAKSGMPAYYRGTDTESLRGAMVTGINVPVQIGKATAMPGDIVLGDSRGVLFVPPSVAEELVAAIKTKRIRDAWTIQQFDKGKYKSSDIYGRLRIPELIQDLDKYLKANNIQN